MMRFIREVATKTHGLFRILSDPAGLLRFERERESQEDLMGKRAKFWDSFPSPHDSSAKIGQLLLPEVYEEIIAALIAEDGGKR